MRAYIHKSVKIHVRCYCTRHMVKYISPILTGFFFFGGGGGGGLFVVVIDSFTTLSFATLGRKTVIFALLYGL